MDFSINNLHDVMCHKTQANEQSKKQITSLFIKELNGFMYCFYFVWFVWFYGISTFVGYLTPNTSLCK